MTYRLALDLGSARIGAAVVEAGNVSWEALGDGGEGLLAAVHVGDDDVVTVGDDALEAAGLPGRFDPDPIGRLGTAAESTESVAALLAAAVATVSERRREAPELVVLAHPDEWTADRGRALAEAARLAEIDSFERVSAGAAVDAYRKVSGDDDRPVRAVGYGAAVLAAGATSLDATQAVPLAGAAAIITLEDIEGPQPDSGPPEQPTYESEGSTSVFDAETPMVPTTPATQAMPVVPPPPAPPPSTPLPPDDGDGDGGARWARWAVVLGVLALVLLLALIVVLLDDGDGSDDVATDGSTTSATGSTTSVAATSSTTSSTSTTSTSTTSTTTTSTTTSTTTTSTTTTSTTTTVAPEPVEVLVEPGELIVDPDDTANVLAIGSDGTAVVSTLVLALGDADDDVVQTPENCATPQTRRVRWGGLEVVLLDDDAQTFGQWVVDDRFDGAADFRTATGVGIGTTVDELSAAYDDVTLDPAGGGLPQFIFVVEEPGGTIVGITTGGDGDDVIESFWSGDGCNNLFAL